MFSLAIFTKNRSNPAYAAARLGAECTATRLGARITHYVPQQPDHIEEQRALVDKAIADRPDACLFVAVDAEAMIASVEKFNAAGIPLFSYINRLQGGQWISFVGSDDCALAERIAYYLFSHLGQHGRVVVIAGTNGSMSGRDRMQGFHTAFAATPGVTLVEELAGEFLQDIGRREMARFLAGGKPFDAVLAANDAMALGAIEAMAAVRHPLCPVVGVNAIPEAVKAIQDGTLLASVSFDAMKMASLATEAAIRFLRGENVPREIILPVEIIDCSNCVAWDIPFEQRASPVWEEIVPSP